MFRDIGGFLRDIDGRACPRSRSRVERAHAGDQRGVEVRLSRRNVDGFGRLHDAFGDRLRILGFPTDDFGRQQGTEEELRRDFSRVLGVLFEPTTTSDNPS